MQVFTKSEVLDHKEKIISAIKNGEIFIYPTDTIYGLGCDATNEKAVEKIREMKQRDQKPFSVIAPSKEWILENYSVESGKLDILPGPYTVIVDRKNDGAVAENVFLNFSPGIRIPDNWFTDIISEAGVPFVTTSVNISGSHHMEELSDIPKEFLGKIDYVVYDGPIVGKKSTRIDLTKK
jgi:L-threonylcarbamoyladenylate synthase